MKFLLTNDDGYGQEGILALEKILNDFGEVFVVAPRFAQSGKGCAFTTHLGALSFKKYDDNHYDLEGTPVDCVSFGLTALKQDFDLVVSGCNNGFNLSYDVMYSGTCGACIQALIMSKPAVAFSTEDHHFEVLKREGAKVFKDLLNASAFSNKYFINVNLQKHTFNNSLGYKITRPYPRVSKLESIINQNNETVKISRTLNDSGIDLNYDVTAVNNGYISISPLKKIIDDNNLTDDFIKIFENKIKD